MTEEDAKRLGYVAITDEELASVEAMTEEERRAWAGEKLKGEMVKLKSEAVQQTKRPDTMYRGNRQQRRALEKASRLAAKRREKKGSRR